MNDKYLQRPISSWVEILRDRLLVTDVDNATAVALCSHLADLGILEKVEEEDWRLVPYFEGSLTIEEELEKRLKDLCATEQGFALRYFLKDLPSSSVEKETVDEDDLAEKNESTSNRQLLHQKTSNLSNLQIVKKYGRQVQSFIELEKRYTERLLGLHTTLKEARKIFNFILSRIQRKTEPRSWEQLSRRRHRKS